MMEEAALEAVVAVPTALHAERAIDALEAGSMSRAKNRW